MPIPTLTPGHIEWMRSTLARYMILTERHNFMLRCMDSQIVDDAYREVAMERKTRPDEYPSVGPRFDDDEGRRVFFGKIDKVCSTSAVTAVQHWRIVNASMQGAEVICMHDLEEWPHLDRKVFVAAGRASYDEAIQLENDRSRRTEPDSMLQGASPTNLPTGVGGHIVGTTFQVFKNDGEEPKSYTVIGLRIKSNRGAVYSVEIGETGEELELSEVEMMALWEQRE